MDKLLDVIRKGGMISTAELARQTGISVEMTRARLEQYARLGYLKKTVFSAAGCGGSCGACKGCPAAKQKNAVRPAVFWELGDKLK